MQAACVTAHDMVLAVRLKCEDAPAARVSANDMVRALLLFKFRRKRSLKVTQSGSFLTVYWRTASGLVFAYSVEKLMRGLLHGHS